MGTLFSKFLRALRVDPDFQRWSDLTAIEAGGRLRVGTRKDSARSVNGVTWSYIKPGDHAVQHLRCVLSHESVFDLGDSLDGVPMPWERTVQEAHAVMLALNRMKLPYITALSGGRGIHIHIFGEPGSNPAAENSHAKRGRIEPVLNPPAPKEALAESPPCIKQTFAWLRAGKNVAHEGRFTFASYMLHAGVDKETIAGSFSQTPNYSPQKTSDQITSIVENGYLPFGCGRMAKAKCCSEEIKVAKCYRTSNPASFLLKPKPMNGNGQHPEAEIDTGPADWRHASTGAILEVANAILRQMTGNPFSLVHADFRLLAPAKDSRLCREFGRKKSPGAKHRKILWTVGPGNFMPLPLDRDEAYAMAERRGEVFPKSIPRSPRFKEFDRTPSVNGSGARCPKSGACIPGHPQWTGVNKEGCETCPLLKK